MKTCLIVDDSKVVRKVARRMLEKLGFIVTEAEDGAQAYDHCLKQLPDLVLLDWYMPVMNGMEFLAELRALPAGGRPVVVFCTTENDVAHIERAMKAGANEYVMKPFDEEILTGKLAQAGML